MGTEDGAMTPDADEVQVVVQSMTQTEGDAQAGVQGGDADDAGSTGQSDDDSEQQTTEIEVDGKKFVVPSELKRAFLQNGDYTRKTQEHAEQVRATEARFAEARQQLQLQAQAQQESLQLYAQVAAIDDRLAEYSRVDWQALSQRDPQAAQAAWFDYQQMRDRRSGVVGEIQSRETQRQQMTQQQIRAALESGAQQVAREIKGWSPELRDALKRTGRDTYGFNDVELAQIYDPRVVRLLHDAHQYREAMKRAASASKAGTNVKTQGAAMPTLSAGGANTTGARLDDRVNADEWMRRRNDQLRRRK
jgi:hypothetical protein